MESDRVAKVRLARIPGLDGLRAIAAILVVVYHVIPGWGALGYTGVDAFFVLSGFLVTGLLIVYSQNRGHIPFRYFWARRVRRLFPAVALTVCVSCALALCVGGDAKVVLGRQVVGSLTATYNWVEIAAGGTYFNENSPKLLTNIWSLAVEQQFYVVWPIIVALLVRYRTRIQLALISLIGILSVVGNALLFPSSPDRAYMGTDTHLWGLMLGAGLAFFYRTVVVDSGTPVPPTRRPLWVGFGGWIALILLVLCGAVVSSQWDYQPWTMLLVSVLSLMVVRSMLPDVTRGPAVWLQKFLNNPIFTWFGVRSYGVYLWHWPLYVLMYYAFPLMNPYAVAGIVVVASTLLAALSYSFVENPIRKMGFTGWFVTRWRYLSDIPRWRACGYAACTGVVVVAAIVAVVTAPSKSTGEISVEAGAAAQNVLAGGDVSSQSFAEPLSTTQTVEAPPTPVAADPSVIDETATPAPDTPPAIPALAPEALPAGISEWSEVTVIGDSVVLASSFALSAAMPNIVVDGEVSRAFPAAPSLIETYKAQGRLGKYVVLSLGTNGAIDEDSVNTVLADLPPDRILVLVTSFGPPRCTWIPPNNDYVFALAAQNPGRIRIADWFAAIKDHTDLLAGDMVHPGTADATALYAATIKNALLAG